MSLLRPLSMVARKPDVLVTIPVFNEMQRLALVQEFSSDLISNLGRIDANIRLVFIDDGSLDGTHHAIREWIESLKLIYEGFLIDLVQLPTNTKKSGMYQAAIKHQDANYYLFVDADGCFKVEDILHCLNLRQNHDVIITYKQPNKSRSIIRRFTTLIHNKISQIIFAGAVNDTQTGLKVFNRKATELTFHRLASWHGFASDFVLIYEAYLLGLNITQVAVKPIHRDGSHIHLLQDSLRYLFVIIFILCAKRAQIQKPPISEAE